MSTKVQQLDPFGGLVTTGNMLVLIDEADSNAIYIGQAQIGSATNAKAWQILKIIISGTNTAVKWAGGSDLFDKVWDSRDSYSFS